MNDDQTVSIEMNEEALKTIESVMPPDPQVEPVPFEIDANGKVQCKLCNMILADKGLFDEHLIKAHETKTDEIKEEPKPEQPQRNEKGQFVEGNTESVGNKGGNECDFCKRPVEILNKITLYKEWCRGKVDGKIHQPYLQEMVSEDYLDITIDQLEDWIKSDKHKAEHSELTRTIKKIMNMQQLNLLKMTLRPDTYRGARFQLSVNHGMIETDKTIHSGDANSPLEFIITEERKIPTDD